VRISAVSGETVAVVTLPDRHCSTTIEPLNSVELWLHMRRSDFATVLREPLFVSYADGTEVRLQAGAVVEDGKVYAHFGGARAVALPIEAPPEKLGVSFPYVETGPAVMYWREALQPGVPVKLGDSPLVLYAPAVIADVKRGGDESVVRLTGACAEATVRIASADLAQTAEQMQSAMSLGGRSRSGAASVGHHEPGRAAVGGLGAVELDRAARAGAAAVERDRQDSVPVRSASTYGVRSSST
jgi:hypothetical protein